MVNKKTAENTTSIFSIDLFNFKYEKFQIRFVMLTMIMQINGQYIRWHHVYSLFEQDNKLPGNLRVCPKLSKNHIQLCFR